MPFFLNVSYVRPHPPFDAPACYFDFYRGQQIAPPLSGDWDDAEAWLRHGREKDSYTGPSDPAMIREAQIGYYACITHLDHQIGRLLEALPANTVVVFTGDHGEDAVRPSPVPQEPALPRQRQRAADHLRRQRAWAHGAAVRAA